MFLNITQAQIAHNLTVFSVEGEKFYLVVNGEKKNEVAKSSVTLKDISNDYVRARVIFEDTNIPFIEKKILQISFTSVGQTPVPTAATYKIQKNKKGEYELRFDSRSNKKIQPKENTQDININISVPE